MQAHGSATSTFDLDIAYARDHENLERLVEALSPFRPRLRVGGAAADVPFVFDVRSLEAGSNFTLATTAGDLDLLGFVTGIGKYSEIEQCSVEIEIFGHKTRVLSIGGLIASKRAAGRKRDLAALPELEALLEAQQSAESSD